MTGGGGSSAASPAGNSASQDRISRAPISSSRSSSNSLSRSGEGTKFWPPPRRARRGNSISADVAEPKRAIRLAKVTGPTCSVRASLSQARRSAGSGARRIAAPADARLLALEQTLNIFPVHEDHQHRQHQHRRDIAA